jgi:L,D-peptidoglycan transpeptidase YkuD (ErfK/YbiS/YcfS/YnhG family)
MRQLDIRRRALLSHHALSNTARTLLSDLDLIPKGTLVSTAHAHGIDVPTTATSSILRDQIAAHLGTGACTSREGYASPIGCTSMTSQFDVQPSPSSLEDPSTRLQLYIMRQVAPTLKLCPL